MLGLLAAALSFSSALLSRARTNALACSSAASPALRPAGLSGRQPATYAVPPSEPTQQTGTASHQWLLATHSAARQSAPHACAAGGGGSSESGGGGGGGGGAPRKAARRGPPILGKRAWQVGLSGVVCATVLSYLRRSAAPRLFALHVAAMAPMLPLATASVSTVRQRLTRPPAGLPAAARRRRNEWYVIRHFVASAAAFYLAIAGLVGIVRPKEAQWTTRPGHVHDMSRTCRA